MAERFRYIDGNNNTYVIEDDRVSYRPITPAESSSGTYSGGEPATAVISEPRLTAIATLVERILADAASHLATRPMGCGTIQRGEMRVWFQSPLEAELERALQAALSGA